MKLSDGSELMLVVLLALAGGLIVSGCVAVVYYVAWRGARRPSDVDDRRSSAAPGWPRRGHYLLLTLVFGLIAVYGSLIPFRHQPLDFHAAVTRFREIAGEAFSVYSRTDVVANMLLFVPIGYCLLGALTVDRRSRLLTILCVPPVIVTCLASSVAIEFAQLWLPMRYTSVSDIVAQLLGTIGGMALWLVVGQTVTDWVRTYSGAQRRKDQIDWLLQAYFLGLLIYSLLPLDLTLSPGSLLHKFRRGWIEVLPFGNFGLDFATFYGLFRDVTIFIPIGMLAATWLMPSRRPVRSLCASVFFGGLFVLAVEVAQLLVYSRTTATADVITGTAGVWVGVCLMRRWRGGDQERASSPDANRSARRTWLWLWLAGLYSLFLIFMFCAPFETIEDLPQIKARFLGFFRFPFVSYVRAEPLDAFSEILRKCLFFAPLGSLLALTAAPLPVPRPIRRILSMILLVIAAGVATLIEMLQVFLPAHVPGVTDVILCTTGAALGMFVTLRIADARRTAT